MATGRKLYMNEEREAAVTRIVAGEKIAAVSRDTKIPAITSKSKAFVEHVTGKQSNIKNGFAATGLSPPSIDMMVRRLGKFAGSTTRGDRLGSDTWLQIREEVRAEVL
ncbi:hypothetical protein PybrP1_006926 [[Pythium] brassicae (nom. inval.)]|nr:hypothetical protein PybrP1_006926 [[Pythium] brassicae (nom. inval.)]